jgi:hypothetical protein
MMPQQRVGRVVMAEAREQLVRFHDAGIDAHVISAGD